MDNPLAFPSVCLGDPGHPSSAPGMTLRDYFAGQALAALGMWCPPDCGFLVDGDLALRARSEWAYRQADAMLAMRSPVAA